MQIAKLRLCGVFAEHNLAFLLADHLIPVIKDISADPDAPEIWERLKLDRKAVSSITKNCIADGYIYELANKIRYKMISGQYDGATDVAQIKSGCIIIKYADFEVYKIITTVWEIFPVLNEYDDHHEVGAEEIFNHIRNLFEKYNIPLNNMKFFSSDGESTMAGPRTSVFARFRQMNPDIITIKCPSHSLHLCAETAIKNIPADIPKFCSMIHSFFCRSPKRQHTLLEFQAFLNNEIHHILRQCTTRWLSLQQSVARIVEQWDVLYYYFIDARYNQRIDGAENILQFLNATCYS